MEERIEGQSSKEGKEEQQKGALAPGSSSKDSGRYDEAAEVRDSQSGISGSEVMGAVGGTATERAEPGTQGDRKD